MVTNNWIFDLMNTLVEIPEAFDEEKRIAKLLGYSNDEDVRTIVYRLCKNILRQTPVEFMANFDKEVNRNGDKHISEKLSNIWLESVTGSQLKQGVWQLLDEMHMNGIKLTLVSNTSPLSYLIIDRLELRQRFDAIVFSCDTGYLKPDPRIFQIALEMTHATPDETVIVGDKIRTDILGGKILGFKSILVENRARIITENNQNYVNAVVSNVAEIPMLSLYNTSIQKEPTKSKSVS